MELSEAVDLSDRFIARMIFRSYGLPTDLKTARASLLASQLQSTLPIPEALSEARRQFEQIQAVEIADDARGRTLHLTVTAIAVHLERTGCPALENNLCGIYDQRPVGCRSVPFHHSRPLSALEPYLDKFVQFPGHRCDTSPEAPLVLQGGEIVDRGVAMAREQGMSASRKNKAWKAGVAKLVLESSAEHGLPNIRSIVENSDAGAAVTASMAAAWTVALDLGILTRDEIDAMRQRQIDLILAEIERALRDKRKDDRKHTQMFRSMLAEYTAH